MIEISEAAKEKARELIVACEPDRNLPAMQYVGGEALARFIQEVSDAAKLAREYGVDEDARAILAPFILPEPVDPLSEEVRLLVDAIEPEMVTPYPPHRRASLERFMRAAIKRGIELAGPRGDIELGRAAT